MKAVLIGWNENQCTQGVPRTRVEVVLEMLWQNPVPKPLTNIAGEKTYKYMNEAMETTKIRTIISYHNYLYHLVLGATNSGKDNRMEHIWRDFGPFWHIISRSFTFLGLCLLTSAHMFSIGLRSSLRWPLQNVDFVVTELFLKCGSWGMLWVIVLLESPPTAKSQPSSRGNQIFNQNCLILGGIHDASCVLYPLGFQQLYIFWISL